MSKNPFDSFFGGFSDPDIDIICMCSSCRKKIGLEKRFIVTPMELQCPYCKKSLAVTEETLKGKGSKDSQ